MKAFIEVLIVAFVFVIESLSLTAATSRIEPNALTSQQADSILRQMSAKIGALREFSFEAHRQIDPALTLGGVLPGDSRIRVAVRRPNDVVIRTVSPTDVRRFYVDGTNLSLLDEKKNLYGVAPLRTSINDLGVRIYEKYGFTPPLAEFALKDSYQDIRRQVGSITYLGKSSYGKGLFGKVRCDRISLNGRVTDAELWIGSKDRLPRKIIVTYKDRPERPQIRVDFLGWKLNPNLSNADFQFIPPKDAQRIPVRSPAEIMGKLPRRL